MNIKLIIELVEKSDKESTLALIPAEILLKFVELIVQECAGVAFSHAPSDESACEISKAIEEHFGVAG